MDKSDLIDDKISATEINKYVYCPYQWYYERVYGAKHIRRLFNERNKALGLDDPTKSNFVKGQKFHSEYKLGRSVNIWIALVLLVIIALLGVFGYEYIIRLLGL